MAGVTATPISSYLVARVQINCVGGGYEHTYDMLSNTYATAAADLRLIIKALTLVLEGNSYVADAVLSSVGGVADGYKIEQDDTRVPQLLINSSGTETTVPGVAQDPSIGIRWRLDTNAGLGSARLLRSIRAGWVNGDNVIQAVSPPSNYLGAIAVGTTPVAYNSSYFFVGTAPYNAADCLSNYFSIVRDKTALYVPNPAGPPAYLQYTFAAANGTPGNPDWQVMGVGRRKIGEGCPPVKGKRPAYA